MSKRILIIGDSFSQLDDKNFNWVYLWAQKYNLTTEHYSIPGGSHVSIISEFFSKKVDLTDVSGIFYFSTDLLRGEGVELTSPDENLKAMDCIVTDDLAIWEHVVSGNESEFTWPTNHRIISHQYGEYDYTTNFYNTISIKWLVRANYNSLVRLVLYSKINNIPVIIIDNFKQLYKPAISKELGVSIWCPGTYSEDTDSVNHVSLSLANVISEKFDNSIEKYQIVPESDEAKMKELIDRVRKRDPFIYR